MKDRSSSDPKVIGTVFENVLELLHGHVPQLLQMMSRQILKLITWIPLSFDHSLQGLAVSVRITAADDGEGTASMANGPDFE
jgi:hypothetical protein